MGCSPRCSSRGLPAVRQSCQRWGCIGATTWACAPGCLLGGALLLASLARLELQLWCCPAAACCPHRCPPAPRLHLCPHRCPPARPSSAPLLQQVLPQRRGEVHLRQLLGAFRSWLRSTPGSLHPHAPLLKLVVGTLAQLPSYPASADCPFCTTVPSAPKPPSPQRNLAPCT